MQPLSFFVDYQVWKLNPFGYHLANILIHAINTLLVFYIIFWLFGDYLFALLSSLLFCVHPIHLESVSFISGRSELLVSLFTLLAVTCYLRYIDLRRGIWYLVSLASFVCALLSKEAGFLIFIPFCVLILGLKAKLPKNSVAMHFISFGAIVLIYAVLRLTILLPVNISPHSPYSFPWDLANFLRILGAYVWFLIFPVNPHILRTIGPPTGVGFIIVPTVFFLFLLMAAYICLRRKRYRILFGIGVFILALLYVIRIMYKFQGSIAMEEHWAYLASAGFFIILADLILSLKRKKWIVTISAVLAVIYAGATFIQSRHWQKEIDFYRYNLRFIEPLLSINPRMNFITALYEKGLCREAIEETDKAFSIGVGDPMLHIQLGDIYRKMGKFLEAEKAYKEALRIDYFCWQANRKLLSLAKETGKEYKDQIDPRFAPAEARIILFMRMGDYREASKVMEEELSKAPTAQLYTLTGILFGKIGLYGDAIKAFNAAIQENPQFAEAYNGLGVVYAKTGDLKKAKIFWLKAIEIKRGNELIQGNLQQLEKASHKK
jgi:tetratricopeptide (TPR) repeat protein